MPMLDMPLEKLYEYQGINERPEDIDEFWDRGIAEMEALGTGCELIKSDFQVPGAECYDMWFTGVGGARVRAVYFVPCGDREHPAWGLRGKLAAAEGLCTRLEAAAERSLTVDGTVIRLEDLLSLEGEGLSDPEWETDAP